MVIDSNFTYENRPGVLVEHDTENLRGFYLAEDESDWESVTEWEVVQWYKESGQITQARFEELFGKIGVDLPQIPKT